MQVQDANLVIDEYDKMLSQSNRMVALLKAYVVELERKNQSLTEELKRLSFHEIQNKNQ